MPDLNLIDDQLQRRGIDPGKLSFLLRPEWGPQPAQPSTPATGGRLSFTRSQPGTRDYGLRVGATTQPNIPKPRQVEATPPEIAWAAPGATGPRLSFTNRQPAAPAVNPAGPSAQGAQPRLSFIATNRADQRHIDEAEAQRRIAQEKDNSEAGVSPTNVPSSPALPGASATGANMMRILAAARANRGADQPLPPSPAEKRFGEMEAQGAPQLHGWKKILDIAGQIVAPGVEGRIPGTPGNFNARLLAAGRQAMEEQKLRGGQSEETERQARIRHENALTQKAEIENEQALRPDNPLDKKIDEYTNDKGQRVLTFQRANGEVYDRVGGQTQPRPSGHTSPFEAFTYGSPEEKKAAQDYLEFEKRMSARYRTPNEFEEKYRLFKEDPETYRAMFGDKGTQKPDTATAARMLSYFDKRRREIQQYFTLDERQKQDQLKDIENLEKPFLDAVQPGANRGGNQDRVEVIHPSGQHGTIPRSQLKGAKKKGYREAPQQ